MASKKEFFVGSLVVLLMLSAGIIYITFPSEQVRIRIDEDNAKFYVNETGWVISGNEEVRIFNGSKLMFRKTSGITVNYLEKANGMVEVHRYTPYYEKPYVWVEGDYYVEERWVFDPEATDVTQFPIDHEICVLNASGKLLRYTVDDLSNVPPKKRYEGIVKMSFGRNMFVEWQMPYRWMYTGWPYGADSMSVQYEIDSDNYCVNVRLFDPPVGYTNSNITFISQINSSDPTYWAIEFPPNNRTTEDYSVATCGAIPTPSGGVLHNYSSLNYTVSQSNQQGSIGDAIKRFFGFTSHPYWIEENGTRYYFRIDDQVNSSDKIAINIPLTFSLNNTGYNVSSIHVDSITPYEIRLYRVSQSGGIYNDTGACYEQGVLLE